MSIAMDSYKEKITMSVNIHGKEYFTVAERLTELNTNVDGNYTIITEMVYFRDGIVVFKATLQIGENTFTGHAQEKEDASMINKTSYIECAETSSIGRALASAGYLGSEFASADEVATAIKNQSGDTPPATEKQINFIKKLCDNVAAEYDEYVTDKMTMKDASDRIEKLQNIAQDLESNYQSEPTDSEKIPF